MKKFLLVFFASLFLSSVAFACGGEEKDDIFFNLNNSFFAVNLPEEKKAMDFDQNGITGTITLLPEYRVSVKFYSTKASRNTYVMIKGERYGIERCMDSATYVHWDMKSQNLADGTKEREDFLAFMNRPRREIFSKIKP